MTTRWWKLFQSAGPRWRAAIVRRCIAGNNVKIGDDVGFGGFPDLQVDDDARVIIGDGVVLRSGVELRAHNGATLVIEKGARIDRDVRLLATNGTRLRVGADARIGLGSVLNGGDDIDVGDKALLSGYVYLQTSMHRHAIGKNIQDQGYDHAPVRVGNDAWLGAHVVVMPGVTIGAGGVVGSNAVVTHNVAAGEVVAGVPAKTLRSRT